MLIQGIFISVIIYTMSKYKKILKTFAVIFLTLVGFMVLTIFLGPKIIKPTLADLQSSYSTIQPITKSYKIVEEVAVERNAFSYFCSLDSSCNKPFFSKKFHIPRSELLKIMNQSQEFLISEGWKMNTYPDSEKLCQLHELEADQFENNIYGAICERDFFKDNIKLKIFSTDSTKSEDGMLDYKLNIYDVRNSQYF